MKEGNAKRHSAVWVFSSGGVLIAAAIIALYTPWSGICDVREIVVTGNQHVSAAELASLSKLHRGQAIFSVSRANIQRRIETHPWVQRAQVRRVFPHSIHIDVLERTMLAWMRHPTDDLRLAIAQDGVVLAPSQTVLPSVELTGAKATGWDQGDALLESGIANLLEHLEGRLCQIAVLRIDVTDLRSIELFLENGTKVRLGGIEQYEDRLTALTALCGKTEIDGYELIDVRFGGEATLVPRKAVRR